MRREPNAFWSYSLRLYRAPAVAKACLALQEQWGADVNLILYCCWLGRAGRALDKRSLRIAITAASRWQAEVIRPVRQARHSLKKPPYGVPDTWVVPLRKRLGALELDLEYLEHRLLASVAQALPPKKRANSPEVATMASLARYLALLGIPIGHADRQVAAILDACCPRH